MTALMLSESRWMAGWLLWCPYVCAYECVVAKNVSAPGWPPCFFFQLGQFLVSLHRFWVENNRPGTVLEAICHQYGLIGATVWPLSEWWRDSGERLMVRLKLVRGSAGRMGPLVWCQAWLGRFWAPDTPQTACNQKRTHMREQPCAYICVHRTWCQGFNGEVICKE